MALPWASAWPEAMKQRPGLLKAKNTPEKHQRCSVSLGSSHAGEWARQASASACGGSNQHHEMLNLASLLLACKVWHSLAPLRLEGDQTYEKLVRPMQDMLLGQTGCGIGTNCLIACRCSVERPASPDLTKCRNFNLRNEGLWCISHCCVIHGTRRRRTFHVVQVSALALVL